MSKNTEGYVSISARSRSKINVQRIMEKMGGGGHFNLAAAQVSDQSISEVTQRLNQEIMDQVIKNEEIIEKGNWNESYFFSRCEGKREKGWD